MPYALNGLTMLYDGKPVLTGICYDFPDHGVVAVEGPSGSGKTTLLRLIAGLEKPVGGQIDFPAHVSMAFQEYRLFPQLTALENASAMARPDRAETVRAKADELLRRMGFRDESLRKRPAELSGGMKQRVSLARALSSDAPVVLLDEPLKELDAALRRTVLQLIAEKGREALVIMTVHDNDAAQALGAGVLQLDPSGRA